MRNCSIAKSSSDQQPFVKQYESIRADVSEGSTNTDEYVTCTDASKRGTLTANATSITQPPPGLNFDSKFKQNSNMKSIFYLFVCFFISAAILFINSTYISYRFGVVSMLLLFLWRLCITFESIHFIIFSNFQLQLCTLLTPFSAFLERYSIYRKVRNDAKLPNPHPKWIVI